VGHTLAGQRGDDVRAEIGVRGVLRRHHVDERLRVEHVVAHRRQAARVVAGHRRRILRLLVEGEDAAGAIDLDDPEVDRLVPGHGDRRHRDTGPGGLVVVDHLARVHAVDVVGTEHAHQVWVLVVDQVEVLVDGVGRPLEPERTPPHLRRDGGHVVVEQRREAPRLADVAVQAVALVLREDDDLQVAGVGEVGQRKVDQAVAATERHRRLGPVVRQRQQPLALPAGEHDHEDVGFGGHRRRRYAPDPILSTVAGVMRAKRCSESKRRCCTTGRGERVAPPGSMWTPLTYGRC